MINHPTALRRLPRARRHHHQAPRHQTGTGRRSVTQNPAKSFGHLLIIDLYALVIGRAFVSSGEAF